MADNKDPKTVYSSEELKVTKINGHFLKWEATTTLSFYLEGSDEPHLVSLRSLGKTKHEAMQCLAKTMMRRTRDFMLTGDIPKSEVA